MKKIKKKIKNAPIDYAKVILFIIVLALVIMNGFFTGYVPQLISRVGILLAIVVPYGYIVWSITADYKKQRKKTLVSLGIISPVFLLLIVISSIYALAYIKDAVPYKNDKYEVVTGIPYNAESIRKSGLTKITIDDTVIIMDKYEYRELDKSKEYTFYYLPNSKHVVTSSRH